jgi:hypothetical protein
MAAPSVPTFDPLVVTTTDEQRAAPRKRPRPQPVSLSTDERTEIASRVLNFFRQDESARAEDKRIREQLYAKLMQFESNEGEGANVALSDILAVCLRVEDQIQNSVMSTRPIMNARALQTVNKDRERKVDLMTDYQFFVEQNGEEKVEQLSTHFVRQGQLTALTQWVREFRKIQYVRNWPALPVGIDPRQHFQQILDQAFGEGQYREIEDSDGWDYDLRDGDMELLVRFFTDEDGVLMEVSGEPEVFQGPLVMPYDYEDVLAPLWGENLQPPGPSNPRGAPHVLFIDYPTRDEILRGVEQGFYDLIEESDLESVQGFRDWTDGDRELAQQRHEMRGHGTIGPRGGSGEDPDHRQLRRILCFDIYKGQDVVWWVLQGPDLLMRARPLTEVCPGIRPVRPIAHAQCIKVEGTWVGMGIPELMESSHDLDVTVFNQMLDAAAFEINPFFKYRQSSNLKPEDVVLAPGRGIPCTNPQTDLIFERIQAQAVQVGSNILALSGQLKERLTLVGDLQVGQIPQGKSAALRTSGGIQQVLAQGEARPERMLRRFFGGMKQIFEVMYRLDRHFLSDQKKFRAADGVSRPGEDPIVTVNRIADLSDVGFDFQASVLNSSKVAQQASLQEMLGLFGSPLMLQLGISTPETLYRLIVDYVKAMGQNPEKYTQRPPEPMPPVYAAEAISQIMAGAKPSGPPAEGSFEAHIQALIETLSQPTNMGVPLMNELAPAQRDAIALYIQARQQEAAQMQQQMQMMQAAQQFQAGRQQQPTAPGAGGGRPGGPPLVSGGAEQVDDTLPVGTGTPQ